MTVDYLWHTAWPDGRNRYQLTEQAVHAAVLSSLPPSPAQKGLALGGADVGADLCPAVKLDAAILPDLAVGAIKEPFHQRTDRGIGHADHLAAAERPLAGWKRW
jgi:hypothetical protein